MPTLTQGHMTRTPCVCDDYIDQFGIAEWSKMVDEYVAKTGDTVVSEHAFHGYVAGKLEVYAHYG